MEIPGGGGSNVKPSEMGDSRKYPYLYHRRLLGFPKGMGGSLNWNSEGMGVFTIGNLKALGGFHRWDF